MSKNYEIERKFLIKMPNVLNLTENIECKEIYIAQTYLKDNTRIRALKSGEKTKYIKTKKIKVSDLTRIEYESEITKKEYEELLGLADTKRQTIHKTRYKYPYKNKVFEIDIFPFWEDRAVVEIELQSENEEFVFPPFLEIIKEVTHNPEYRNFAIAKKIPKEKI